MIKSIFFLKRKRDERGVFPRVLRNKHGRSSHRCRAPRYVQSHTIPSAYRKGEPLYDGVAELWYDDVEALRRTNDLPHARRRWPTTSATFDMSKIAFLVRRSTSRRRATRDSMVKLVEFVTRKPGVGVEAFRDYWRTVHGPLAAKLPDMRRYVQCHPLLSAYRGGRQPLYDGVVDVWFDRPTRCATPRRPGVRRGTRRRARVHRRPEALFHHHPGARVL